MYNASKRERSLAPVDLTKRAKGNKQDREAKDIKPLLFKMKGTQGKQEGYCDERYENRHA